MTDNFESTTDNFELMLDKLYDKININNNNTKIVLPKPIMIKSGNKTIWKNPDEFINMFNRQSEDFTSYINNKTTSNINWISESLSDGCIFDTKVKKDDYIYDLMKRYVTDRILCKSCKSIDTVLIKDQNLRKYKFTCNNCKNELYI